MKNTAFTLMTGIALVCAAQAGPTETTPAPAPAPSAGLWEWFAGGSVGYLTDLEEPMYTLHAGMERTDSQSRGSHAIYLEVGFAQDEASYSFDPPPPIAGGRVERAKIELNIVPVTLNYKYEAPLTERLNYYLGLGLGVAILDSSYDWSWTQAIEPPDNEGSGSDDQTNTKFYGHVFAGLSYDVSDAFEIFGGARYIFMDDADLRIDVTDASKYTAGINGDILLELGARYHF